MTVRTLLLLLLLPLLLPPAAAAPARGEVLDYKADIDGEQTVPSVTTPASGSAVITIDTLANTLAYNITFSGLIGTETGAHIHGFAFPGLIAAHRHTLPEGSPKIGVWNYQQEEEGPILAGLTYINIHSTFGPGGEIRGQIVPGEPTPAAPDTWSGIKRLLGR